MKALRRISGLGKHVLEMIKEGKDPYIEIPIRSLSNVIWDEKLRILRIGPKKKKRYFLNVAHARKFMQTMLVAALIKELLERNIHTSLRDMFYALKHTIPGTKENTFEEQNESDSVVVDLEVALDLLREQLHLNADTRGRLVGPLVIEDRGDEIDCSRLGSGGWAIPSNVESIKFKEVGAEFILVIEKNAGFERLNEDKFWKRYNAILISTQGQAARGARRLIHRLHYEHNLPVYVFTDADAYGWYIYSVIKQGSINLAYISEKLGTPDAKFIGLTLSDMEKYDLKRAIIKAKETDIKRAKELLQYPWFKHPEWQRELNKMIKLKIKAELEALSARDLQFMSKVYLPEKIENKEFLP